MKNGSEGRMHQCFVLYSLVGEPTEVIDSSNTSREPENQWNAFLLEYDEGRGICLRDVDRAFPLDGSFHFAFRNQDGFYVDIVSPYSVIPTWQRKIVAKITPLALGHTKQDDVPEQAPVKRAVYSPQSVETEPKYNQQYQPPEQTPSYEASSSIRKDKKANRKERRASAKQDHPNYQNAYAQNWPSQEANNRNARSASEWSTAAKDAQNFIWKQTETAYGLAKKVSSEDARKAATETAKKARKWGGTLLSSISSSISGSTKAPYSFQVNGMTFQVVRHLADGAYAQVFLVREANSGEVFALKRVLCQSEEVATMIQTELHVFRSLQHPNIMPLVDFAQEESAQRMDVHFLLPFIEKGSVATAVENAVHSSSPLWPFNQRVCLHLFRGICAGVVAMHRAGLCHRDLKLHNIMLKSEEQKYRDEYLNYSAVITDFGSVAPMESNASMNGGEESTTISYRAPELFDSKDVVLDGQSDVWSMGCILYAMAFGNTPFEHPTEGFMKLACLNGRVPFPPEKKGLVWFRNASYTVEFCDFIRDMLHTTPEERPSALDALEFAEELLRDEEAEA